MKYFCNYYKERIGYINHPLINFCIQIINQQLRFDYYCGKPISFLAKWVPREKSQKFGWFFSLLAYDYFSEFIFTAANPISLFYAQKKCKTEYRKLLSQLNASLGTLEVKQCNKKWSTIDFSKIPSTVSCGETFENYTGYANIYVLFESNVSNRQPISTAQACPRINIFLDPIVPADITEPGFYKFNFFLNGTTNKKCGIDTIAWNYIGGVGVKESQDIEIESCPDFPIITSRAGEFNDQIRKQINIVWPGNYYFRIKIS
jgi:hypothetical protein